MRIESKSDLYRKLPSVDELLRSPALSALVSQEGQLPVADATRVVLATLRAKITDGTLDDQGVDLAISGLEDAVERQLRRSLEYSLREVINATGVILHTNLGRAPLGQTALDHILQTAGVYSNLEFDLETGERSKRDVHVERLFRKVLGAADPRLDASTIVVNNNAAAVLLALNALADGGEVIVSRGELVEIGGSFRIPDVMSKSGAALREVGTTNRTRVADYERAINEKTRLILRVHRSNFEITGFTEQPELKELVNLAHERQIAVMEDLGSGALLDLSLFGITGEPSVFDSLHQGVDVVTYSGDKLLGGPQAGMMTGRSDLIARIRSNPLFRALRVDKLTYAALEATLLAYVKGDHDAIPAVRMMRASKEEIRARAGAISKAVQAKNLEILTIDGESVIGGGAAPSAKLPTTVLAITCADLSADEFSARLRAANPPIVTRVEEGRVIFDLRTVFPEQDLLIISALGKLGS